MRAAPIAEGVGASFGGEELGGGGAKSCRRLSAFSPMTLPAWATVLTFDLAVGERNGATIAIVRRGLGAGERDRLRDTRVLLICPAIAIVRRGVGEVSLKR